MVYDCFTQETDPCYYYSATCDQDKTTTFMSQYTLYADNKFRPFILSAYSVYANKKLSAYTLYADKANLIFCLSNEWPKITILKSIVVLNLHKIAYVRIIVKFSIF